MKSIILHFIISLIVLSKLTGQHIQKESIPEGEKLYKIGIEFLEAGDYRAADSVFSEAICTLKNEHVYYNRGLARLLMKDTIGFCTDMDVAAYRYYDHESAKLFNQFCCNQVDTIYYNKKFETVSNSKYRFYEVIQKLKYDPSTLGTIHDIKDNKHNLIYDYECESDSVIITTKITDVIGSFILVDSMKCFYQTSSPIAVINQLKYDDFIYKTEDYLRTNYNHIKDNNNVEEIELFYEYIVTEKGKVINVKYSGTYPELLNEDEDIVLEKELLKLFKAHPKFIPARLRNEKVNFIEYGSIIF